MFDNVFMPVCFRLFLFFLHGLLKYRKIEYSSVNHDSVSLKTFSHYRKCSQHESEATVQNNEPPSNFWLVSLSEELNNWCHGPKSLNKWLPENTVTVKRTSKNEAELYKFVFLLLLQRRRKMREIINVQVGQCGNQVAYKVSKKRLLSRYFQT